MDDVDVWVSALSTSEGLVSATVREAGLVDRRKRVVRVGRSVRPICPPFEAIHDTPAAAWLRLASALEDRANRLIEEAERCQQIATRLASRGGGRL
jgi:hypothetical protein